MNETTHDARNSGIKTDTFGVYIFSNRQSSKPSKKLETAIAAANEDPLSGMSVKLTVPSLHFNYSEHRCINISLDSSNVDALVARELSRFCSIYNMSKAINCFVTLKLQEGLENQKFLLLMVVTMTTAEQQKALRAFITALKS